MHSMRSHYRCVCGRTYIDKLYVFDRVIEPTPPPPPPPPPSLPPPPLPRPLSTRPPSDADVINDATDGAGEDSTPHSKDEPSGFSQNDPSTQAWHTHELYNPEVKVVEDEVTDDLSLSVTPIDDVDIRVDETTTSSPFNNQSDDVTNDRSPIDDVDIRVDETTTSSPFNNHSDDVTDDLSVTPTDDIDNGIDGTHSSFNNRWDDVIDEDTANMEGPPTSAIIMGTDVGDETETDTPDNDSEVKSAIIDLEVISLDVNSEPSPDAIMGKPPLERQLVQNEHNVGDDDDLKESLSTLVQTLQDENQLLVDKLSSSHECQMYLREENQRLVRHIEEMAGIDSHCERPDSSSTDTEKELEQFKRQYAFLNHELKVIREENIKLLQSEALLQRRHEGTPNTPLVMKSKSREGIHEIITAKHTDNDGVVALDTSQGKDRIQMPRYDENHNALPKELPVDKGIQTLGLEMEQLEQCKTSLTNIQNGVQGLKGECGELQRSHTTLKNDAGRFSTTMAAVMADTSKQIMQALASMNIQNEKWKQKYIRELKLRKQLQNQVVDFKGNIRVFCRIRPCIKEDNSVNDADMNGVRVIASPDVIDEGLVYIDNKGRHLEFDMDKVFGMGSSQEEIFDEVSPLVRSVIDGYNVCIFAYGQTGSGKTYTMEGPSVNPGINQRALQLLFEGLDQDGWAFTITASVLEIYNETIRDLLNSDISNKLEVKIKPEGGLHVPGVVVVPVTSLQEVNKVSDTGRQHRFTASTSMNDLSSRSHCLLCVNVHGYHQDTRISTTGRLNLVDLAGSERVGRSHADGVRLKEAQNINKSLACLGDVIHALRAKQGHVPYRNSKLTYLLQDSLGGDSKTLMIVQVSPAESNVSETVCTLNFGQRVRSVEMGQATKNVSKISSSISSKRPTNLTLPHTPNSPRSPSSPSSVFGSPTLLVSSPSSPHTPNTSAPSLSSPLSSSASPKLRRSTLASSSSMPSPTSSPSSPSKQRKSILASQTTPSSPTSSPSSPLKQRRFSTLASSSSSSSSPPSPSSPPKQRRFALSSASTTSPPSSPHISSTSSPLSKTSSSSPSPSSPKIRRTTTSTPSSTTSSSSSHTTSSQLPKSRKSTLSTPLSGSSSAPSSPSLRRSTLSSSTTSSPASSSTSTTTTTASSSPYNSPTPRRKTTTTPRPNTTAHPSPTRHTKSSLARNSILNSSSSSSSSQKPPSLNSPAHFRTPYLPRPKNTATPAPSSSDKNTRQNFLSSYPPTSESLTKRKSNSKKTSDASSSQIPFRI